MECSRGTQEKLVKLFAPTRTSIISVLFRDETDVWQNFSVTFVLRATNPSEHAWYNHSVSVWTVPGRREHGIWGFRILSIHYWYFEPSCSKICVLGNMRNCGSMTTPTWILSCEHKRTVMIFFSQKDTLFLLLLATWKCDPQSGHQESCEDCLSFQVMFGLRGGEEDSRGPNEIFLRNNNFFVVFARDCPFVVRSLFFDLFLKTSECAISHLFFGRHRVFSFPFWLRCPSHVWLQEIQFQSLNIPFVWSVILSTNASSLCIKWPTVHCRMRTNCRLTTFSWSQGCRCRLQTSSRGRSSSRTNGWNRKWRKVRSSICRVLSPTSALLQPIWFSRDSFAHSHSTNPRSNSRARCFCRATGDVHEGSGRVDHRRRRQRGGSGPRRRQPRWVARMRRKIHCLD